MSILNISKFIMCSEIEGPGKRFVLFVQGCNIGCKNCSNQDMLPLEEKLLIHVNDIFSQILIAKQKYNIVGITILGGEPFLQPDGIKELLFLCKKNNIDVICFTGYLYKELVKEYKWIDNNIDILIDGPFIWSQLDLNRRLIGSKNQIVYKLSKKYKECNYFEEPYSSIEIQIYKDRININGDGTVFDNKTEFNFEINKNKKE